MTLLQDVAKLKKHFRYLNVSNFVFIYFLKVIIPFGPGQNVQVLFFTHVAIFLLLKCLHLECSVSFYANAFFLIVGTQVFLGTKN